MYHVEHASAESLHVREPLTREETVALRDSLPTLTDRAAVEQYWLSERGIGTVPKALDQYAQPLRVPQLVVTDGKRTFLFEPTELDEYSWNLNRCDAALSEKDFSTQLNIGDRVAVDLADRGGVRIGGVEEVIVRQLSFAAEGDDWSNTELVRWLDGELHHGGAFQGLAKAESQAWLLRVTDSLITNRKADPRILVRNRHDLADVLIRRMTEHGREQVREAANMLVAGQSPRSLETSMDMAWPLSEPDYCPYRRYDRGLYDLGRHAFDLIGDMNGEEADCAKRINDHLNVNRWVRNLEPQNGGGGYSLPLSPGRFFPDFIAELKDGRTAIIEYKNPILDKAEQHKKDIGDLWAARFAGKGVFVWIVDRDWTTLETRLASASA
jgi:type III restriction enzyme